MVVQCLGLQGHSCYEAKSPSEGFEMEPLEDDIRLSALRRGQLAPLFSSKPVCFASQQEGTQTPRILWPHFRPPARFTASLYACARPRCRAPPGARTHRACAAEAPPLRRCPRKRFLPTQPPPLPGSQEFCLSRLVGPLLHGPVCQECFGGRPVRQAGPRSDLWILESVTGAGAPWSSWRGRSDSDPRRRPAPAGRHGRPIPQLRVGPGADPVADRPHAERLLRLPGPVAGAGGLAVARQPLAGPDVRRRDPGLFHPFRPALHDVLHPQRPHLDSFHRCLDLAGKFYATLCMLPVGHLLSQITSLMWNECPGLAVLHPAREAVSGFHCHCPFLSPPGLLVLQLPFPLGADLVAGPSRVHCTHGCHRGVPVHADGAQGDPPQLSP